MKSNNAIIFYDGECVLCSNTIRYIIKHDERGYFKYCSLQSSIAGLLLKDKTIPNDMRSIIVLDGDKIFTRSDAVFHILKKIKSVLNIFYFLKVLPGSIKDAFYNIIAKNRYKWFGKLDRCQLPDDKIKARFLD